MQSLALAILCAGEHATVFNFCSTDVVFASGCTLCCSIAILWIFSWIFHRLIKFSSFFSGRLYNWEKILLTAMGASVIGIAVIFGYLAVLEGRAADDTAMAGIRSYLTFACTCIAFMYISTSRGRGCIGGRAIRDDTGRRLSIGTFAALVAAPMSIYPQYSSTESAVALVAVVLGGVGAVLLQMAAARWKRLWAVRGTADGHKARWVVLICSLLFFVMPMSVYAANKIRPSNDITDQLSAVLLGLGISTSNLWWVHFLYVRRWATQAREVVVLSALVLFTCSLPVCTLCIRQELGLDIAVVDALLISAIAFGTHMLWLFLQHRRVSRILEIKEHINSDLRDEIQKHYRRMTKERFGVNAERRTQRASMSVARALERRPTVNDLETVVEGRKSILEKKTAMMVGPITSHQT